MSKWSSESTGISVLRPLADEQLALKEKRTRVWNEARGSWGFYAPDANDDDAFLVWSSLTPGDRLFLDETQCTVVAIRRETVRGTVRLGFKLLTATGSIVDVFVEENDLFKIARKYI